jgi:alanine racemase
MRVRPTEAIVDLEAIRANYRLAVELCGRPAVGVVKADAYGHGAAPVARALVEAGAPLLAVALVEEALALREAGVAAPVLVMGGAYGGRYDLLLRHRLTPLLSSLEQLAGLAAAARAAGVRATAHLKVDTGMGRLGLLPAELGPFAEAARAAPEVEIEGLCTHFASADAEDRGATERQVALFEEAAARLARAGIRPRWRHLGNSAGTIEFPAVAQDLARPGIMLYGYLPQAGGAPLPAASRAALARLRPALTWRTAIVHLKSVPPGAAVSYGGHWVAGRPSRVATLAVGYADGYPRRLSGRPGFGRAEVLVGGRRCPVAGTVCMDMVMADVTAVPGAAVGDEAVLVGAQGEERIGADELAGKAGTIAYEILCGIGARVPRRHRGAA